MVLRIATFNVENLDDEPGARPSLEDRLRIMVPQLRRIRADVLCLQEVHSAGESGSRRLAALDRLVEGTACQAFHRATTLTTGGEFYHERNLVTLSRFPITEVQIRRDNEGPQPAYRMVTAQPPETEADDVAWERPLLYTRIALADGVDLHLLNLHLKSKRPSNVPGQKLDRYRWKTISGWAEGSFISAMKRLGQALQVRMLVDELFDRHGLGALIAVCGDLNADTDEEPVAAICGHVEETGNPDHAPRILVPCENNIPESSRYSLLHLGRGEMLDHVLASRTLLQHFRGAEVHNEALPDESGAFRSDLAFPESDHAPVVAEFDLGP